jgi:gluconate kinase
MVKNCYLITGTSGTGKSTIAKSLEKLGYDVIDTDHDYFNGSSIAYWKNKTSSLAVDLPWPPPTNWSDKNDWVWRIDKLKQRLDAINESVIFVCGDSRNKLDSFHLFRKVFVLKADNDTLHKRLQSRTDNLFGQSESEFRWVLGQNKIIVEEVKSAGGIVVDATKPLDQVIKDILDNIF